MSNLLRHRNKLGFIRLNSYSKCNMPGVLKQPVKIALIQLASGSSTYLESQASF